MTDRSSAEAVGGILGQPAALRAEPTRTGEMIEGHYRHEAALAAAFHDAAVVIEHGDRINAGLRLDARPFEREPIAVQAQ